MASAAVALFRAVLAVHAVLVVAQPVAAGAMLQASVAGRAVHQGVGGVLLLVAMVQIPLAVLAWWPGRWPAWPVALSVLLLVAETTQLTLGYAGSLGVHLPLGVAITLTVLALTAWSLSSWRPRRRGSPVVPGGRNGT